MSKEEKGEGKKERTLLGIFDSGIGGFSVCKKIRASSTADCIYYGDCARAPYGNREEGEILRFIKDDITFLQEEDVTHFINACNSMSVITTRELLKECGIRESNYTDMIRAFTKHMTCKPKEKVLVLATAATIRSGAYQKVLEESGADVYTYAYADLAGAIESSKSEEELIKSIAKGVDYGKSISATSIIYGCTHYPLIHHLFMKCAGAVGLDAVFIDPAVYVAEEVRQWGLQGERKFMPYSSKDTPAFIKQVIACV